MTEGEELPERVLTAYERAATTAFHLAGEAEMGILLAVLAAAVRSGGRVLEIGTGTGVGLAWLVRGLSARSRSSSTMRCGERRCASHAARRPCALRIWPK